LSAEQKPGGFLAAFSHRNFRRLWVGAFLSSVGTWTQDVALSWMIHTQLIDPRYLGYRSFAADAPLITFMLIGGAAADRVDRRRILLTSNVLQMTFATALGLLYAAGRLGVAPILLFAFLTGLAQSQSAPTYQAVLTSLVPPRQIQSAVALNSLQFNLSRVVGPAIAGVLLAQAGTGWCFAVNAVSFLAVIVALWRIEIPSPGVGAAKQTLRESLVAGLRHVEQSPILSVLVTLAAAGSFLAFPLITYLPVLADETLHTGATGYSSLLASFGVGAIVGAIATAQRGHFAGRGHFLIGSMVAFSLATTAAVLCGNLLSAMGLLFVSGWSLVSAFSILNSLVQESAPDALRGRVVSIYGFFFRGGMPLGSLIAGFLVRGYGASHVLAVFASALMVAAVSVYARSARLRAL
jgi:predicted MFS family arabinose efflux permease